LTALFEQGLNKFVRGCGGLADKPQRAGLSAQMAIIMTFLTLVLAGAVSINSPATLAIPAWDLRLWVITILMISVAVSLIYSRSFLTNMVSFSVLGLTLSYFFMTQGAPDVAMTPLLVEILTVVILVLALLGAPLSYNRSSPRTRPLRSSLASLIGLGFTILLARCLSGPYPEKLKAYFLDNSLPLAHGRNVVNVILVDFRAFDTLGEVIVVLGAAVGVWLLARRVFH
jgi:multicomponent Na+:H+ antiporter subunit A